MTIEELNIDFRGQFPAAPMAVGYSRDQKQGKTWTRHLNPIANALHVAQYENTMQYIYEPVFE